MRIHGTLACALLVGTLHAQGATVIPAPKPLLESLNLWEGSVQSLPLPLSSEGAFSVDVVLGARRHELLLHPYEIYAPGAVLVTFDEDGHAIESPLPPSNTFRGTVVGVPDSWVAASLYNGQLSAIIAIPGGGWSIDPASDVMPNLPQTAHVVYRHDEMRAIAGMCETVNAPLLGPADITPPAVHTGTANAVAKRLAFTAEIMPAYANAVGGTNNAINRVSQIANGMGAIYTNWTVFSSIRIVRILVSSNNLSTNAGTALRQLRNRWLDRFELNFATDAAQGFTNFLSGGTIGIAYLRGACTSNRVSVVQNYGNVTQRTALSTHEVGHLVGAGHCSGGNCYLMCPSLGGCGRNLSRFGPTSQNAINNFVNPRAYFDN